ncbi:MAG: RnfABCDGE type electron transport complex subunit G [Candidatus Omnitrophota bacterium]
MKKMLQYAMVLSIICFAASFVLALTNKATKPVIEAYAKEEEKNALKMVMPLADSFEAKKIGSIQYYDAYKGKRLAGYCVKVNGSGYSGPIRMLVGITEAGVIQGVSVLSQAETPGLGARIVEIKRGSKRPWFLQQFIGKNATTISLDEIDAITAATISSKAVVEGINTSVNSFLAKVKR